MKLYTFGDIEIWIWYAERFEKKVKQGWTFLDGTKYEENKHTKVLFAVNTESNEEETIETLEQLDNFLE